MPKRLFREKYKATIIVIREIEYEDNQGLVEQLANAALEAEIAINSAPMPDGLHVRVHLKGV